MKRLTAGVGFVLIEFLLVGCIQIVEDNWNEGAINSLREQFCGEMIDISLTSETCDCIVGAVTRSYGSPREWSQSTGPSPEFSSRLLSCQDVVMNDQSLING